MEMKEKEKSDNLQTIIKRPPIVEPDRKMMELAVNDAGTWCYGIKAIDVWFYRISDGRLVAARGGRWVDPVYFQTEDPMIHDALMRIYDPESANYIDASQMTVAAGEGLAGAIWADTAGRNTRPNIGTDAGALNEDNANSQRVTKKVQWRDVAGMANDPDQPYNENIKIIVKAGFGLAAGVPFNISGIARGIVIYLARKSVDMTKITSFLNEQYMLTAAQHIGSVLALRKPRSLAIKERDMETKQAFRRAQVGFKRQSSLDSYNGSESPEISNSITKKTGEGPVTPQNIGDDFAIQQSTISCDDKAQEVVADSCQGFKNYVQMWITKMQGGNVPPSPGMPWKMVFFAMWASFVTVFIMTIINVQVKQTFGTGFELGQIGGLSALVFTLSAAPGAQPQSIIFAQLICMFVGMIFSYIPHSGDPFDTPVEWFRVASSVSVACALMARFGIVHPPGGGLAVIFLQFQLNNAAGFKKMGVLMLQDVLFISFASILNNLNTNPAKRYPTYWGYIPNLISKLIRGTMTKILPEKKDYGKSL